MVGQRVLGQFDGASGCPRLCFAGLRAGDSLWPREIGGPKLTDSLDDFFSPPNGRGHTRINLVESIPAPRSKTGSGFFFYNKTFRELSY